MSLNSLGHTSNGLAGNNRMTHSLSTPSGVDGATLVNIGGGKKLAVRVQMLDDSMTMFQVQVRISSLLLYASCWSNFTLVKYLTRDAELRWEKSSRTAADSAGERVERHCRRKSIDFSSSILFSSRVRYPVESLSNLVIERWEQIKMWLNFVRLIQFPTLAHTSKLESAAASSLCLNELYINLNSPMLTLFPRRFMLDFM